MAEEDQEVFPFQDVDKKKAIRLTRDTDGKIVKIELYVNDIERREIFAHFPDKIISWKEAAPHLVILNSFAAYKKKQLIAESNPQNHQAKIDKLAKLAKALCHHTAPLYALINDPNFDYPSHPANKAWKYFLTGHEFHHNKTYLKILFIKAQLTLYRDNVNSRLNLPLPVSVKKRLPDLFKSQQEQINEFITQLDKLLNSVPDEALLQKLLSNQDKVGSLNLTSLGEFLRSQAHTLTGDVLAAIDELSEARFDQLFSFSAHPLRKEFARARKTIDDQRSTQAVRFMNTRLPIPEGQLAVLNSGALKTSEVPLTLSTDEFADVNTEDSQGCAHLVENEPKWLDIMPYVNGKTLLGSGIEGREGLDDVDHVLDVYANDPRPLKKPRFFLYRMLMGEQGVVGILATIFFGLPLLAVMGVGLIAGACLATAFDLVLFLLQILVFIGASPLLLVAALVDFILQIPSFFIEGAEIPVSCLKFMAKQNIPPAEFNKFLREISAIRQFKQFFLNHHKYYFFSSEEEIVAQFTCIDEHGNIPFLRSERYIPADQKKLVSKQHILDQIKRDQAESLFNVVASNFFTFSTAAKFLQEKLKQLFYAVRELRKVIIMTHEVFLSFVDGKNNRRIRIQTDQRNTVVTHLKFSVEQKREQLIERFSKALSRCRDEQNTEASDKDKFTYSQQTWPVITCWTARQSPNPFDFFSDIAAGAVGTVDFAFTEDPGIATPMFVLAILGIGALLFPSLAGVIPAQIIYGLQWVPQKVAKAFMGKTLQAGLSDVVVNILSNFLQWQLTTYGMKGVIEVYHGNFEWIKKLFDYPEEITLSAATFVSLGYGISFIPNLPTDAQVFSASSHPLLNTLVNYPATIYNGFASAFNVIIDESREVVGHAVSGLNTLELAFIGLKSSLLIYGLLSGSYESEIKPLQVNFGQLCREYFAAKEIERLAIIQGLLKAHNITDPDTELAKQIHEQLSGLANNQPKSDEKEEPELDPKGKEFLDTREDLKQLLNSIQELEALGMSIDLLDNQPLASKNEPENKDELTNSDQDAQHTGYQSKLNAELIYDALFFAIENYNQAAKALGLFHQQIDGSDLLHNFYNKHCYTGSSGWQKIVFGLLLFPVTWVWRGLKYLIGTPSMRYQVKKSFCEDFAMLFQLIPDVIAPVLRSFLKATLYAIRMVLGVLLLPVLVFASGIIVLASALAFVGIIPVGLYALVKGVQADDAKIFSQCMANYFNKVKQVNQQIWQTLLCNRFVNKYLKAITFIGGTMGTGSPHRLNILKILGLASCYEYLTAIADNHYEALPTNIHQLNTKLAGKGQDMVDAYKELTKTKNPTLLALKNYQNEVEGRWVKPVSEERPRQVAYLSDHLFNKQPPDPVIEAIITSLNTDADSKLAHELRKQGAYPAVSPLLVN